MKYSYLRTENFVIEAVTKWLEFNGRRTDKLRVIPLYLNQANDFVSKHHRHHSPITPRGHKFSLGAISDGELVGVSIVKRPVNRSLDDGLTLEVFRLATDGHKNACSFLYGASARATRELGYLKIGTYILDVEPGTSLKASGWLKLWDTEYKPWDNNVRSRPNDSLVRVNKQYWVKYL